MDTNLFYAKSIGGKLHFSNQRGLEDYLFSVDTKNLTVIIDREKTKRTLNQNAYYWFYLRIIANETGETEDKLHQLFKRIFLPPVFTKILGKEVKLPRTTKNLSKYEFSQYMDKICAETNVPMPDIEKVAVILDYPKESIKITAF